MSLFVPSALPSSALTVVMMTVRPRPFEPLITGGRRERSASHR